jgi:hydrogenase 3 maturation protease
MSRIVVLGIGNPHRGDDRAGVRVARLLRRLAPPPEAGGGIVAAIDAGTVPEAYAEAVAACQPDVVLLVDAVDMGAPPGRVILLTEEGLTTRPVCSSHRLPLLLLMRYLHTRTGARILLLGIQAGTVDWYAPMTPAVRRSTADIVRRLCADPCEILSFNEGELAGEPFA